MAEWKEQWRGKRNGVSEPRTGRHRHKEMGQGGGGNMRRCKEQCLVSGKEGAEKKRDGEK